MSEAGIGFDIHARKDPSIHLLADAAELDEVYSRDPWRWMCQQVMTVDESGESGKTRILPWPRKRYLYETVKILQNEQLVAIPKSRRMMLSWLIATYFTWDARYHDNTALFWQSQTEAKAAYQVDKRCYFIETHIKEEYMRKKVSTIKTKHGMIGTMTYENGSYIWAVAEGGDVLRNYTATKIMMDESEFQQQAPDAIRAALPLVDNGAQLIVVSSSGGPNGVLAGLCRDVGFTKWLDIEKFLRAA